MALENNLVVDSDAELKAFLSSILSSEGIVVNINRTFIAYNNGTNRNRVFARCANRMAQKGTDEKFVVIALMCYPALNWILKARDIDAMIEQLHDMDTDGSVRNISEIQSLLENSTGYVKPRLHLEMHCLQRNVRQRFRLRLLHNRPPLLSLLLPAFSLSLLFSPCSLPHLSPLFRLRRPRCSMAFLLMASLLHKLLDIKCL